MAEQIGIQMAEAWFAKLQLDFPRDDFRVYYTRDDEPTVRFHRVYRGEPVWMDEPGPETSRHAVRVWDTRQPANRRSRPAAARRLQKNVPNRRR